MNYGFFIKYSFFFFQAVKTDPYINYEENSSLENNSEGNGEEVRELKNVFYGMDLTIIIWFLLVFFIRLISCPNLFKFIISPLNIIDIASSLPSLIILIVPTGLSSTAKEIIRVLRILLLLKITRFSNSFKTFVETLKTSYKEFSLSLIFFAIGMVFFSTLMYYCEKDSNPTQFPSIYDTFW